MKYIASIGLLTALASPALAQGGNGSPAGAGITQPPAMQPAPQMPATTGQSPRTVEQPKAPGRDVRDRDGSLIGTDPDPKIRDQMKADPHPGQ